jgi:hypothetical protein
MGYQSIRGEFDGVKELIIKLQRNPLNYLIKEAHQKIRREDIRKRIQLPLTDNIGLEYRLQEYENFFLIQKAITWALE